MFRTHNNGYIEVVSLLYVRECIYIYLNIPIYLLILGFKYIYHFQMHVRQNIYVQTRMHLSLSLS